MDDEVEALAAAEARAERLVADWRGEGEAARPAEARRAVYIVDGCDCAMPGEGGRYHAHAYTPDEYQAQVAAHERRVVRVLPV